MKWRKASDYHLICTENPSLTVAKIVQSGGVSYEGWVKHGKSSKWLGSFATNAEARAACESAVCGE